jgi:hypothetical protein
MVIRHQECLVISHELPEVLEVALIFFNHLLLSPVILRGLLSNLSIEVIFSGGNRSLPEIHETTYGGDKPLVVKSNELVDILAHEADVPQWNSALLEFRHIAQEVQPVQIDVPLSLVQDQHEGGLVEDFVAGPGLVVLFFALFAEHVTDVIAVALLKLVHVHLFSEFLLPKGVSLIHCQSETFNE